MYQVMSYAIKTKKINIHQKTIWLYCLFHSQYFCLKHQICVGSNYWLIHFVDDKNTDKLDKQTINILWAVTY